MIISIWSPHTDTEAQLILKELSESASSNHYGNDDDDDMDDFGPVITFAFLRLMVNSVAWSAVSFPTPFPAVLGYDSESTVSECHSCRAAIPRRKVLQQIPSSEPNIASRRWTLFPLMMYRTSVRNVCLNGGFIRSQSDERAACATKGFTGNLLPPSESGGEGSSFCKSSELVSIGSTKDSTKVDYEAKFLWGDFWGSCGSCRVVM